MFYVANQILQNAEDAEDTVHQAFRFRFTYAWPFAKDSLMFDTSWKRVDAEGNDCGAGITVYASQIAGFDCVNAVLVFNDKYYKNIT